MTLVLQRHFFVVLNLFCSWILIMSLEHLLMDNFREVLFSQKKKKNLEKF